MGPDVVAGTVGLLVQASVFVLVFLATARSGSLPKAFVFAAVTATFGYSLVTSALLLLAVPWQLGNGLLAVGLAAATAFRAVRRTVAEGWRSSAPRLRSGWPALLIGGLIALFHLGINVLKPVLDVDGQLYHGPTLASIIQAGSLWGWSYPNQYLAYTDLTMAGGVNLATATGVVRFDDAIQIPYLLLLIGLVVWALDGRFRSATVRTSVAFVVVSAPVIWLQARVLYVDAAYAAAVVAAALIIVRTSRFRYADSLVLGAAIAAIFATKPAGLLTGAIMLVLAVLVIVVRRIRANEGLPGIGWSLLALAAPLVAGASFYLRNLFQFRNPVFPVAVDLGPLHLPGIVDFSVFASGDRGNGLFDPGRWSSYGQGLLSGIVNGVTKPDYDPRAGGYGWIPILVVVLVLVALVIQWILIARGRAKPAYPRQRWLTQIAYIGIAAAIVSVQPAASDSRYVIGPTVLLLCAAMMCSLVDTRTVADIVIGVLSIVIALGQVVWTEDRTYPGLAHIANLSELGPAAQPPTPGNPWGPGDAIAWLETAADRDCVTIALETSGGLTPSGMGEPSYFGNQPYGLYGEHLCNSVRPITMTDGIDAESSRSTEGLFAGADFALLYDDHVDAWADGFDVIEACYAPVAAIPGSSVYPQDVRVLANTCR